MDSSFNRGVDRFGVAGVGTRQSQQGLASVSLLNGGYLDTLGTQVQLSRVQRVIMMEKSHQLDHQYGVIEHPNSET